MQVNAWDTLLTLLCCGLFFGAHCEHDEDTWIEPNAWGREGNGLRLSDLRLDEGASTCGQCAALSGGDTDNAVALIYYKKLIALLFNRKNLKYDESNVVLEHALLFRLLPAQLQKLEELNDPRDLDIVLTDIFAAARTLNMHDVGDNVVNDNEFSKKGSTVAALLWDILKDLMQLLKISEVKFSLLVLSVILLCWYLNRSYQIGVLTLIVGGVVFFGYFVTYLECNRKLEVEQMLEILAQDDSTLISEPRWYTPIINIFNKQVTVQQKHSEQIKKSSRINLAYCRPDHVFMLYINDLFLKQLEYLLEKCITTLSTLRDNFSLPYFILAAAALVTMIAYITKLTFKYVISPSAWLPFLRSNSAANQNTHQQQQYIAAAGNEDRISGENLKLLLNAINKPSAFNTLPVSGVEDVLEQLEQAPDKLSSSSSAETTPNTSLNVQQTATLSDTSINNDNATKSVDLCKTSPTEKA